MFEKVLIAVDDSGHGAELARAAMALTHPRRTEVSVVNQAGTAATTTLSVPNGGAAIWVGIGGWGWPTSPTTMSSSR